MPADEFFGSGQPRRGGEHWDSRSEPTGIGTNVHYAGFWARFAAGLIDYGPTGFIWILLDKAGAIASDFGAVIFFGAVIANNIILQGRTGQSIGKRMLGLRLAYLIGKPRDHTAYYAEVSLSHTFARQLAHILDMIFIWGWLRPMWNRGRRTYADSVAQTVVIYDRDTPLWTSDQVTAEKGRNRP